MTKLIGFTGAGGTGKTTIAKMIGNNVPSYVSDLRAVVFGEYSAYEIGRASCRERVSSPG